MKSAVFYGKNDLRIEERSIPEIESGQVLVRVHACGICGTDVHIFSGDEGAAKTPSGTVLGHEFSGEIVKIGANVKGLSVGDKVCIDPNQLCGECEFCRRGIGHFCTSMVGIGTTVDGGFEEYCAVNPSQVYKFNDKLSYEEAAMTEPLSCCIHGINLCDIKCGNTVAVIGCGMIGLIMIQLARLHGAAKIIAIETNKDKFDLARKMGADIVINPAEEAVPSDIQTDVVIECVGNTKTIAQAIEIAGKYSTVMMFGLTKPEDTVSIKPFEIFKKEITLKASFINPYTFTASLRMIESGKIDIKSLIYSRNKIDKLPAILGDKKEFGKGKHIITL